ncbi:family 1 glycosylhydrolase [Brevundimonas sp.]|uniref:family 1 glycosylhydrolase n=1 Tax=Brevundimonas sp. TaxID=1871086 RepID=UPI00345C1620
MATATYQVVASSMAGDAEGIHRDRFSHTPGMKTACDPGDRARDHHLQWREDLDLMTQLNPPGADRQ